ncbi:hypothetical protein GCM10011531_03030 [Aquaticitalea lipolytica]|uniref:Uncharacterized protein n=1 Tax=Aquaticitalea lipolytica TaxID=1247562 RepID=A0A8J2XID0_9FLAO|nr:hypothetical protein [Aquaticitalea lipolytica]GFZ77124.1 hypothetical protein GCM10011531_03030 [Aquaticitalea lipolytica]
MVLNNIEKLLEKYDNGETTLKEEQQLRAYFAQNDVEPHLESYKVMFQYYSKTKQEKFTKDVPLKPKKNNLYKWISVAAVAVLMFGAYTQFDFNKKRTIDDLSHEELLAYNQTKEAFNLLASKFSEGTTNVKVLGIVGTQFEKASEKVDYINEFSNTTNKFFKNK